MDIPLEPLIDAAQVGGKIVKRYFGSVLKLEEKTQASDFRTQADVASEQAIIDLVTKAYPTMNIFAEESGKIDRGSEYSVLIDPLDGTNNFALGIPMFSISLAIMHNDEIVMGVIDHPLIDCTYWAQKGSGAFLNGHKLTVSGETDMKRATVSYICHYRNDTAYGESISHKLNAFGVMRETRNWSSAQDYCLLAAGKIEGIINKGNDLYDFAAGKILVREAGGLITDHSGQPAADSEREHIASNGKIHTQLIAVAHYQSQ